MAELFDDVVTLVDEEGAEHDFIFLDIIMVNDNEYAIMIPSEAMAEANGADDGEQEAVIFRIDEDENGEQSLVVVEDDAEWEAVAQAWEEQVMAEEDEAE
ncbi:MAG TPA: DUF1292 domain-containing protein [Firmicutes bacterium]|nr:DUF1292 domain-containing protein [Bacillota bacterium]